MSEESDNFANELIQEIIVNKIKIILFTFFITILTLVVLIHVPNTYKSSAVLSGADISANSNSNFLGSYSDLASIAGISISSPEKEERVAMGIEIIKSLEFFKNISTKNDIFFKIMAVSDWDKDTRENIINNKVYNVEKQKWIYTKEYSENGLPSLQTAHIEFLDHLTISTDRKTGFIKISFVHFSPDIAREIVDTIISEINESVRKEDIIQAENSIEILTNEYNNTQLNQIRSGLSYLIQQNIEKKTIAITTPEYLFKVLSDPISDERKHGPHKLLILMLSIVASLTLSIIIFLLKKVLSKKEVI